MSVYHHIRQLVVQEFFLKRSDFPGKRQNWISFVFTLLRKRIKVKVKYKSVVKTSGLSPALISYNHPIRGSSDDGASFTYIYIFLYFQLVYCLPAFHC